MFTDQTSDIKEIPCRHIRIIAFGHTIRSAVQAFQIASQGAFPEQVPEGMQLCLVCPETIVDSQEDFLPRR